MKGQFVIDWFSQEKPLQIFIKKNSIIIIGVLAVIIGWHTIIAITSKIQLSGFFMEKPAAGYTWRDSDIPDSKFFWQNTDVKWKAGLIHTTYNIETAADEGIWNPQPGYQFMDKANSLETVWKQGLLHPDFRAWSDTEEGKWLPVTGYKFVYENGEFVDAVWESNKRFEDLKITSQIKPDHFIPFPGYRFSDPAKTLKVVWTPGLVNSENTKLVAGKSEGTWEVNNRPFRRYYSDLERDWYYQTAARRAFWYAI